MLAATRAGDRRDAALSHTIGRVATDPLWGLPILALVLLLAYKIVGVFGAGTAVDFVERRIFGGVLAQTALDAPVPASALAQGDFAAPGTERLVVLQDGPSRVRIVAQSKQDDGVYVRDPTARIDVYPSSLRSAPDDGAVVVQGVGETARWAERRAGARVERVAEPMGVRLLRVDRRAAADRLLRRAVRPPHDGGDLRGRHRVCRS